MFLVPTVLAGVGCAIVEGTISTSATNAGPLVDDRSSRSRSSSGSIVRKTIPLARNEEDRPLDKKPQQPNAKQEEEEG
jgi:hypothetical protein